MASLEEQCIDSENDPPDNSVLLKCNIVTNVSSISTRDRNSYKYTIICTVDYTTETISKKWRTVLTLQTERFSIPYHEIFNKVKEHVSKKTYDTSRLKIV